MLNLLPVVLAAVVTVSPSGKMVTQTPKVAAFHAVEIGGGIDATVSRGGTAVKIEVDEAVAPYLVVEVTSAGVLKLGFDKKGAWMMRTGKVLASISTPNLDGVQASGGATVHAMMTAAKKCDVGGSGGSELTLTAVTCEQLAIDMSGGSRLEAVGSAKKVQISASGGSHVGLRQVAAGSVSVDGSGGSEIRAFATAELSAELTGGTELYVAGHPTSRNVESSGGAQIIDVP